MILPRPRSALPSPRPATHGWYNTSEWILVGISLPYCKDELNHLLVANGKAQVMDALQPWARASLSGTSSVPALLNTAQSFAQRFAVRIPLKSLTEVQRVKPSDSRNPETQQNPFKNTIPKQQIIFQVDNGCICGLCGHTWIFSVSLKSPRLTFKADTLYFPMRTG